MTLRHLNKLSKSPISGRTLVSVLLFVILTACGTNPVASSPSTGPLPNSTANKPIKTASAVPSVSPTAMPSVSLTTLNLNAPKITEDAGSLHVQSDFGFQCPHGGLYTVPMDQLVLASDRTTYSQDEITQMGAYVSNNYSAGKSLSGETAPPPTLRWVLGGSMEPIPGTYNNGQFACGAELDLTNTGSTPIQIPQVGVRLEERPQPNAYTYRLIDVCTIKPKEPYGCLPQQGGQSTCSMYTASIQLGLGEKNDVFSAMPTGTDFNGGNCGPLTIAPATPVRLFFKFSLAANIPRNLLYSITPLLTVNTEGEQTVALSHLVSTLAFANANQFSCYGLQGTTFVLEPSPVFSDHQWCE